MVITVEVKWASGVRLGEVEEAMTVVEEVYQGGLEAVMKRGKDGGGEVMSDDGGGRGGGGMLRKMQVVMTVDEV